MKTEYQACHQYYETWRGFREVEVVASKLQITSTVRFAGVLPERSTMRQYHFRHDSVEHSEGRMFAIPQFLDMPASESAVHRPRRYSQRILTALRQEFEPGIPPGDVIRSLPSRR